MRILDDSEKRHRFVQALIDPGTHRRLRLAAAEEDVALGKLLKDIIADFLERRESDSSRP